MCFWKSYICSKKLDVQETNFSFTQFNRIRNHLLGRRIEINDTPSRKENKNQVKTPIQYNDLESCNVDHVSSNVKCSQSGAMLYILKIMKW